MKKIIFSILLTLLFPFNVFAQEQKPITNQPKTYPISAKIDQVNNFKSEITINKDTSISIIETINYQTNQDKHGIFRYIPIRYSQKGLNYTAKVKNISVKDVDNNSSIPYTKTYEDKYINLKIGYPEKTFTGEKTYIISYDVENALKKFDKYDELYWDIVGEGWQIPVLTSQALVKSPYAKINSVICFSGRFGSDDKLCSFNSTENEAVFSYNQTINYGDNITVAVALSQTNSQIIFPTKFEQILKTIKDNFILLFIPFPAFIMFALWFFKGRDYMFLSLNVFDLEVNRKKQLRPLFYKHRTPMVYEPLKDLTPGEAGAIFDERVDNQDIISEIIDLARKKFLKIERIEKKGFLSKSEDYKFTKLKEPSNSLPAHQKYLLENIFSSSSIDLTSIKNAFNINISKSFSIKIENGKLVTENSDLNQKNLKDLNNDQKDALENLNKKSVMLSDLKGTFYTHMDKTRSMINDSLKSKNLFTHKPAGTRIGFIALAIFLGMGSFFIAMVATAFVQSGIPILLAFISAIISLICAYQMPQKTAVGTNFMLQAKGLQHTIKLGEWREKIKEKNLFIEEILPFAISLGVVKELAKDMEKLNINPPQYLDTVALNTMNMSSFVNSFSQQASSNLSYNPSSSSYSGGSGFSGGGSSGGGGGGGGGGSW